MNRDDDATVRALLAASGIRPPEEELLEMVRSYPALRAAADALYSEAVAAFLPAFFPTDEDLESR